nr:uncharacterized protein LOC111514283 [Leptinotarsa decemlineata]
MSCYIRMRRTFLQGLLWLYLFGFGFMALSLEPGFLDFDNLPDTNFTCVGKVIGGYYADLETNCQMFHVCTIGQLDEPMDIRFLCLNGTVFDQETRVCERIDEVDCSKSERFYSLNLELYGNSQPSNLEEISETEQPLIIKSTLPTTTTTESTSKTTRTNYYTTVTSPTTGGSTQQLLSAHHFPLIDTNSPDIRFNPEEINISLHPGAPPDIRTNPHSFYSDKKVTNSEKKVGVTTHRSVVTSHRSEYGDVDREANTKKSLSGYNQATPGDINYGFTFKNADLEDYRTEDADGEGYHYQTEFRPSQEYSVPHHNIQRQSPNQPQQYTSSTFRNEYTPTTSKLLDNYQPRSSTTARNYFIQSLKPPALDQQSQYSHIQSEKPPQRMQLPLPLLPTLPPLTFSSPAPFSLQHRIETKRYTKDHYPPPRIVISASASVSDASGRRLNYSLGTIGTAPLFKTPPSSYDEYKDEDVQLDPFYHDVQKVKHSRKRRSVTKSRRRRSERTDWKHSDIIKNDDDAIHVLKFIFDWYKNEKTNPARTTTPISAPLNRQGIVSINDGLSPDSQDDENSKGNENIDFKLKSSDVFNEKSKYSIVGNGGVSVNHQEVKKINNVNEEFTIHQSDDPENGDEIFQHEEDYINDNFEPVAYNNKYENEKEYSKYFGHDFSKGLQKKNHKPEYSNEKESSVNYGHDFSEEDKFDKNFHRHDYENDKYSSDYERDFKEEREREDINDQLPPTFKRGNANNTHYHSLPNDYVDDNIEPIYYKERNKPSEIEKSSSDEIVEAKEEIKTVEFTTEKQNVSEVNSYNELTSGGSSSITLSFTEHRDLEITTMEYPEEQTTPEDYNNVNILHTDNATTSEIPSQTTEVINLPSTISSDEFEVTFTTEVPTTTTRRERNNRRRGRRKYQTAEGKDKETDFKKVLIEKLIEKPFRAKDDYDYLRTVHLHTTTTGEGLDGSSFTESQNGNIAISSGSTNDELMKDKIIELIPTITEPLADTKSSSKEIFVPHTEDSYNKVENETSNIFLTSSSTTETSISKKRRRGKQRNYIEPTRKKASRRRKPMKSTETKEYHPGSQITYLGSVEIITNPSENNGSSGDLHKNLLSKKNYSTSGTSQVPMPVERMDTGILSQNHEHFKLNQSKVTDYLPSQVTESTLASFEITTEQLKTTKLGRGRTRTTEKAASGIVNSKNQETPKILSNESDKADTFIEPSSESIEITTDHSIQSRRSRGRLTERVGSENPISAKNNGQVEILSFNKSEEDDYFTSEITESSLASIETTTNQLETTGKENTEKAEIENDVFSQKQSATDSSQYYSNQAQYISNEITESYLEPSETTINLETTRKGRKLTTEKAKYEKSIASQNHFQINSENTEHITDEVTEPYWESIETVTNHPKTTRRSRVKTTERSESGNGISSQNHRLTFSRNNSDQAEHMTSQITEPYLESIATTTDQLKTTRSRNRNTLKTDNKNDISPQNHGQAEILAQNKLNGNKYSTSKFTDLHSKSLETSTDRIKTTNRSRGRAKFHSPVLDLDHQSTVIDISRTTPLSIIDQIDVITTSDSPATESLSDNSVEMEESPTSTSVYGNEPVLLSERIEDIYATSFVPTTESIHITKKKQLKDNLLNSELTITTESNLDVNTIRVTDVTEEFREETTLPASLATTEKYYEELVEEIESTTGSYFSHLSTTNNVNEKSPSTRSSSKEIIEETSLIRNESIPTISKAMNLLSIVVEEKLENSSPEETSTEIDFTTSTSHKIQETSEIVTHTTVKVNVSSSPESSTEIVYTVTEDKANLKENTTETFIPTTEISETSMITETKFPEISTAISAVEPTTLHEEYSQIQTTLEQTTLAPVTTKQTTTLRTYPSRPNRKGHSYQRPRHRFSSDHSIRKQVPRKPIIKDKHIESLSRQSKKMATSLRGTKGDLLTEYPLMRSVHPTQAERTIVTTPFSRKTTIRKYFFFNCFGKELEKFYPDSRDCRLFHYCTKGYNKNQLIDMKFVCDLNTFFDDEKLICTKEKPKRCL